MNNENFPMPKSEIPNPHFGKRKTENGKRGDEAANLFNFSTFQLFNRKSTV